ncbi:hypothetical protein Ae201684P_004594 [Aphanomyces euteiches]|uniref:Myb-like domain-containing protein n=1 Tax=Aphanomyces euteiches TaxID=100861 RepID=A0A6G0XDF4_9STRA|nr:hypothetical protein Ae201684_006186 [Aphanomyces euteiches]KAH9068896.1 hypothetical protein Ae201684P_004594 [Aphanomyces euteiches]KAH9145838.1 hypothetical protein AeRB84_010232 [Aphanomyces euteiches]
MSEAASEITWETAEDKTSSPDTAKEVLEIGGKKRWVEDDDIALLQQGIAWDKVASSLLKVDGFSRRNIDGKKAFSRFSMLMAQHKAIQEKAKGRSGSTENVTPKTMLLDELLELYMDSEVVKI